VTNNRYYSNAYGRFMTPDPYQGASGGSGDPDNPQSWNRYAYTVGDPVNWVDPSGQFYQPPQPPPPPDQGPPPFVNSNQTSTVNSALTQKGKGAGPPQSPWTNMWWSLSPGCRSGLSTAMPNSSFQAMDMALERAQSLEATLQTAVQGTQISWTMVAAIAIRESAVQNINQNGGNGVGVFQIDLGYNPSAAPIASNILLAATWVASYLNNNIAAVTNALSAASGTLAGWSGQGNMFDIALADTYNEGLGGVKTFLKNGFDPDLGTTGENYGQNISQLMNCFNP